MKSSDTATYHVFSTRWQQISDILTELVRQLKLIQISELENRQSSITKSQQEPPPGVLCCKINTSQLHRERATVHKHQEESLIVHKFLVRAHSDKGVDCTLFAHNCSTEGFHIPCHASMLLFNFFQYLTETMIARCL